MVVSLPSRIGTGGGKCHSGFVWQSLQQRAIVPRRAFSSSASYHQTSFNTSNNNNNNDGGMSRGDVRARSTREDRNSGQFVVDTSEKNGLRPRICIVGGGFGGLYTAIKLEQLIWPKGMTPRVTLVDQHDRFSFKPLLYDVLTESATQDEVAPLYSSVLAPYAVNFVQGRVNGIEHAVGDDGGDHGRVVLQDGTSIGYDWLVMALGSTTKNFGIPGVREYALQFSTYEDAVVLKNTLDVLRKERNVRFPEICIVGGGYAGVELAAALVDRLGGSCKVQLVTSSEDIMVGAPDGQRRAAQNVLDNDTVSVIRNTMVDKIQVAGGDDGPTSGANQKRLIHTTQVSGSQETKSILEADVVLWTAGQQPAVAENKGFPFKTNVYGAMETDRTLKVVDTKYVFALGDVAVSGGEKRLPTTAQVALQQADYVAWNIWASINNKPLLNFQYQHLGNMMSLGATKGAVSLPIPVPPPISAAIQSSPVGELLKVVGVSVDTTFGGASDGITIEGPFGALVRRAAYLLRQPTDAQRLNVVSSWAKKNMNNLPNVSSKQ